MSRASGSIPSAGSRPAHCSRAQDRPAVSNARTGDGAVSAPEIPARGDYCAAFRKPHAGARQNFRVSNAESYRRASAADFCDFERGHLTGRRDLSVFVKRPVSTASAGVRRATNAQKLEAAAREFGLGPAFRRPSMVSFEFDCPPRAIHADIRKAGIELKHARRHLTGSG
jgi:hypothetical protein